MSNSDIGTQKGFIAFVERVGKRIPDPVIIFIYFLIGAVLLTALIGGLTFETYGAGGVPVVHEIRNMLASENVVGCSIMRYLRTGLGLAAVYSALF